MSKSKRNFPDPMLIFNNYGADACRLYLCNSPVVRAEELKFKEISEILGTSVGGLKASYHLAAKKIEEFLKNR